MQRNRHQTIGNSMSAPSSFLHPYTTHRCRVQFEYVVKHRQRPAGPENNCMSLTCDFCSRTNLAVLIYEQTFTNCVCFCYRKNTKNLQQPRNGTSDAVIKHDVQEWFQFGVKYDGGHRRQSQPLHRRRRNQTQTITCFNFGHRYNADNGMERLVLKMAVPLSCEMAH